MSTDLIGRGIDIEGVNVVFNYDMPETDQKHGNGADTYLHRVSNSVMFAPCPLYTWVVIPVFKASLMLMLCFVSQVGRAGRFGTKGLAITFVASEDDSKVLNQVRFVHLMHKLLPAASWLIGLHFLLTLQLMLGTSAQHSHGMFE